MPEGVGEAKVDEARARHLGARHLPSPFQARHEFFRESPRRESRRLCQNHRRIGGDIAMRRIARRLDGDAGRVDIGWQANRGELGDDDVAEVAEKVHPVVAYRSKRRWCSSSAKRSVMPAM